MASFCFLSLYSHQQSVFEHHPYLTPTPYRLPLLRLRLAKHSDEVKAKWNTQIREHFAKAKSLYDGMIASGIAKECARFALPLATPTRLYMKGSVRSWIHYIDLRSGNGTQKEHMIIANECKSIFCEQFPTVAEALGWK